MGNAALKKWADKLGIAAKGREEELRATVERTLATKYLDADLMECTDCKFAVPDVPEVDSCPGCGAEFEFDEEPEEESVEATTEQPAKVTSIATAKAAKQKEEKEAREAEVRKAETEAVQQLENIEKKIDTLLGDAGCIEWDIGKHLNEIWRNDLWQAAAGPDDAGYKSFTDYVTKRFDFTKQTARAFMRIADHFSREEASAIPLGHLRLLVSIPDDEARQELVKKVREEDPMTFRELASHVKAKRQELGLETSRAGMEGTVLLNARLKPGVVFEGKWKKGRGKNAKRTAKFEIGEHSLTVEDLGDEGFVVKLAKPRED